MVLSQYAKNVMAESIVYLLMSDPAKKIEICDTNNTIVGVGNYTVASHEDGVIGIDIVEPIRIETYSVFSYIRTPIGSLSVSLPDQGGDVVISSILAVEGSFIDIKRIECCVIG